MSNEPNDRDREENSASHIPPGYENFPKEVVQMLMKSHPIKGKDYNEEEFNHEMARIARRKKIEENQRQGVEVRENTPPQSIRERMERREPTSGEQQERPAARHTQEEQPAQHSAEHTEDDTERQARLMQEAEQKRQEERAARQAEIARQAEMARRAEHARQAEEEERMRRANKMRRDEERKGTSAEDIPWVSEEEEEEPVHLVRQKPRPGRPMPTEQAASETNQQAPREIRMENAPQPKPERRPSPQEAVPKHAASQDRPKPAKHYREEDDFSIHSEEDRQRVLDTFTRENQNDYEYEEEERPLGRVISLVITIALAVVVVVLLVRSASVSSQLTEATQQLADLQAVQQENEDLKLQIVALEEQLGGGTSGTGEATEGTETPGDGASGDGTTGEGAAGDGSAATADTYTVQEGDVIWSIAEQVYGNGAEYQRILDANGLTESDYLQPGQVLTIPR